MHCCTPWQSPSPRWLAEPYSLQAWHELLQAHIKFNNHAKVQENISGMLAEHVQPDMEVLSEAVATCSAANIQMGMTMVEDVAKAVGLSRVMRQRLLVTAHSNANQYAEAERLLSEMQPDVGAYSSIFQAMLKAGETDKVPVILNPSQPSATLKERCRGGCAPCRFSGLNALDRRHPRGYPYPSRFGKSDAAGIMWPVVIHLWLSTEHLPCVCFRIVFQAHDIVQYKRCKAVEVDPAGRDKFLVYYGASQGAD